MLCLVKKKIYRLKLVDHIETFSLLNIVTLSAVNWLRTCTGYDKWHPVREYTTYISVALMMTVFLGIICYQIITKMSSNYCIRSKRQTNDQLQETESVKIVEKVTPTFSVVELKHQIIEHLENLSKVLTRLQENGVKLKKSKCDIGKDVVQYLGHKIDAEGIHATDDKIKAITEAPPPKNLTELRSFLGLLNYRMYYGRFIPNLSTLIHSLNRLLKQDSKWNWTDECEAAFTRAKEQITSSKVLVHYDSTLPLKLAGDASNYGLGTVISHVMPDGTEHPIAFASRTLLPSERNYSQIEKEALSLVFGLAKFHTYLYGRKFVLVTDHKPLTSIFGLKKGIPAVAAARLQRWAVKLSAYNYQIEFRLESIPMQIRLNCFLRPCRWSV